MELMGEEEEEEEGGLFFKEENSEKKGYDESKRSDSPGGREEIRIVVRKGLRVLFYPNDVEKKASDSGEEVKVF